MAGKRIALTFNCSECGSDLLYEFEAGPILTRRVTSIDLTYHCSNYSDVWVSMGATKWWCCGDCGLKLPADNVEQLIKYLESQRG